MMSAMLAWSALRLPSVVISAVITLDPKIESRIVR